VVKARGGGEDGDGDGSCGEGGGGGGKVEDVDGSFPASVMWAFCDEPSWRRSAKEEKSASSVLVSAGVTGSFLPASQLNLAYGAVRRDGQNSAPAMGRATTAQIIMVKPTAISFVDIITKHLSSVKNAATTCHKIAAGHQ